MYHYFYFSGGEFKPLSKKTKTFDNPQKYTQSSETLILIIINSTSFLTLKKKIKLHNHPSNFIQIEKPACLSKVSSKQEKK